MTARKSDVCARLVHIPDVPSNERYATQGQRPGRTDICGLDRAHTGEHEGLYKCVRWTYEGRQAKILSDGRATPAEGT